MRITTYRTELDENLHNTLVKEKSRNFPVESFRNPKAVVEVLNSLFRLDKQAEEYVYMLAMNTKGRALGVFEVSHGTVNQSICSPRDIFIKALLCGAVRIILVHNHPSGDPAPSTEDITMYKRLREVGDLLDIKILDSIIVGNEYFSFQECGML